MNSRCQRKWYSVWDSEVPKFLEPKKPLSEYLKETKRKH